MSFQFEWPTFSEAFYDDARLMLEQALNKGTKPPIIADRIEVKELNMGTLPPELEILEIGDLSTDRFRGIFRLTYTGDAYIVLQTKVQANPLNVPRPSLDILGSPRILFAAAPLIVPMTLRLSSLSLRAIVVLVVSRQKGITLVFKNDPLESVNVSSSFDGVDSVAGYIQKEIEGQLREAFRSDLPGVIHRLSQKWLSGEVKSAAEGAAGVGGKMGAKMREGGFDKDAKIETRTQYGPPPSPRAGGVGGGLGVGGRDGPVRSRGMRTKLGGGSVAGESVSIASDVETNYSVRDFGSSVGGGGSPPLSSRRPHGASPSKTASTARNDEANQSVAESIENYDPTYGLRPDAIPLHAGFGDYERFVRSNQSGRGLGDVLASSDEEGSSFEYDDPSFDMIGLGDLVEDGSGASVPQWEGAPVMRRLSSEEYASRYSFDDARGLHDGGAGSVVSGYETIPAVGGGTITRPRIFHTQSQMHTRAASSGSLSAHGSPSTATVRSGGPSGASTVGGASGIRPFGFASMEPRNDYFAGFSTSGASNYKSGHQRSASSSTFSPTPSLFRSSRAGTGVFQRPLSGLRSSLASSATSPDLASYASPPPYSSPPSSVQSPTQPSFSEYGDNDDGRDSFPPTRPDPIDLLSRSPSSFLAASLDENLPITLNPMGSDSYAHLASLTSSNQTLSPFTRDHEHFTARSSPHVISRVGPGAGRGLMPLVHRNSTSGEPAVPVKGVRKRVHRFGSATPAAPSSPSLTRPPVASVPSTPTMMGVRVARPGSGLMLFSPGSSIRSRSTPPSEMSDFFPSLPMLGGKGPLENLRREFLESSRR